MPKLLFVRPPLLTVERLVGQPDDPRRLLTALW